MQAVDAKFSKPDGAARVTTTGRQGLGLAVFAVCLLVYGITAFGALRSPDSEVVFEVCEALVDHGTFAVEGVSAWEGFGLAPGRDGRMYSVFGVGQSLASVPFLWAGRALGLAGDGAPAGINPSFYVGQGREQFMDGVPAAPRRPHGDRFVVAYLNVLVSAFGAWVFFAIARRLARHSAAALGVTALYAFGTLSWSYSGGCFSEPLAILFVLLSLLGLLRSQCFASLASGLALGFAVATHVTAMLFIPFFAAAAFLDAEPQRRRRRGFEFCAGLGAVLILLGLFNHLRFGSPFETGRTVDATLAQHFGYGHAVAPWAGLAGFAVGGGKSLFVFIPAVLGGLALLPRFLRTHRMLGLVITASVITRLVFIAARSDWHGGFCLGPRLLLMIVPLLLLPIVPWLDRMLDERRQGAIVAFAIASWACVAEQLVFVVGEPFSYYWRLLAVYIPRGTDLFAGNRLYLDWAFAPLLHLLAGQRGPWLWRAMPLSNAALWAALAVLAAGLYGVAAWLVLRRRDST